MYSLPNKPTSPTSWCLPSNTELRHDGDAPDSAHLHVPEAAHAPCSCVDAATSFPTTRGQRRRLMAVATGKAGLGTVRDTRTMSTRARSPTARACSPGPAGAARARRCARARRRRPRCPWRRGPRFTATNASRRRSGVVDRGDFRRRVAAALARLGHARHHLRERVQVRGEHKHVRRDIHIEVRGQRRVQARRARRLSSGRVLAGQVRLCWPAEGNRA